MKRFPACHAHHSSTAAAVESLQGGRGRDGRERRRRVPLAVVGRALHLSEPEDYRLAATTVHSCVSVLLVPLQEEPVARADEEFRVLHLEHRTTVNRPRDDDVAAARLLVAMRCEVGRRILRDQLPPKKFHIPTVM